MAIRASYILMIPSAVAGNRCVSARSLSLLLSVRKGGGEDSQREGDRALPLPHTAGEGEIERGGGAE